MTYSLMPSSFIGAEGGRNGQREKERVGGGSKEKERGLEQRRG